MNTLSNTARHDMLAALIALADGGYMAFETAAPGNVVAAEFLTLNTPFASNTNGVGTIDETGLVDSDCDGSASAITKVHLKTAAGAATIGYMTCGLSASEVIVDDNVLDLHDTMTCQAGGTITMPAS